MLGLRPGFNGLKNPQKIKNQNQDWFFWYSIYLPAQQVNREEAWYYSSIYYLFIPLISGDKIETPVFALCGKKTWIYFRLAIYPITAVMDPILFRVVSPQKTRLVRIPRMHVLLCYGCPCARHLSWNTCLSVDQEVSLEVAQASKIWICRTIFRCTVRTHVVCGDCFPLNLHGGGDNYIHITTIDYNTWGRCGINMTFNFLFIIGDELKSEKKRHQTMFDAYNNTK